MKVTYAPLVSDARGKFQGLVASNWKGISLVRVFAKPSNPNTALQQEIRAEFQNLNRLYAQFGTKTKDTWDSFATGKKFIGRNHFIGVNIPLLQGDANNNDLVPAPGDASAVPPTAVASSTPGVAQITLTFTNPAPPTGWTLTGVVGFAVRQFDYGALLTFLELRPSEGSGAGPLTISLPTAAVTYVWGGWLEWVAPDGTTRYSSAITGTQLVT